jgi:serine/threonine protein kinase
MMMCDSNNVVKCYDVYQNNNLKVIVMEYCNGG